MKDLRVPMDFKWTSATTYSLSVDISGSGDGKTLRLYDKAGNFLDGQTILNNQVIFNYQLPDTVDSVRI
jgi:hypothetical protein